MNSAIKSVFSYYNTNKLSLNLRKTNYMVVTSPKIQVEINTGVFIDKHLSWGCPYTTC